MKETSIRIGRASAQGKRDRNEDFCAAAYPDSGSARLQGALAALADGVSGGRGREAAETAVRGLLADYYTVPETWEAGHAFSKLLLSLNRWMHDQNRAHGEGGEMLCAISALVLKGHRYTVAHAGDTRVYLLRERQLTQLTEDHVWDKPDMRHVLKRAMGLDAHLVPDIIDGELQANDRFLLLSDGVWAAMTELRLNEIATLYSEPQSAAQALIDEALKSGSQDNVSALVIHVDELAENTLQTSLQNLTALPVPLHLQTGGSIDGLAIGEQIHSSRETCLYRVQDERTGQQLVLKTLAPLLADDVEAKSRLAHEEWLARRISSHYFPQCLGSAQRPRQYFYLLFSWHEGASLQRLVKQDRHFSTAEVAGFGIRLLKGLSALHRLDVLHRDIKPDNLHLGKDGKLRILDLGVASCESLGIGMDTPAAGTPSYLPPESFSGTKADRSFDIYASGVTLYTILTRKYPYGEIEPFQHPKFGDPVPPTRYRPDIPGWLEDVILKAVARERESRFETTEEMLLALERGSSARLNVRRKSPLAERNPVAMWQGIALVSMLFNLLLIYLLVIAP
ncbi:MAG: bifunctional protein-serine/threonine kinase/phosphatase [Thiobacillaceae bacterium]